MNKRSILPVVVCLLLSSLLLSSCSGVTQKEPTLTLSADDCVYTGPKPLPSEFTMHWQISDDSHDKYSYAMISLDTGKTKKDLQDHVARTYDSPDWVTMLDYQVTDSGNKVIDSVIYPFANARYHGEEIYVVCFLPEKAFVVGPLKVKR